MPAITRSATAKSANTSSSTIHRDNRLAATIDGADVHLTPKEFDLLARLAHDAGAVVTRDQLFDDVWDENWWGSTKTLDVHINAVRRKLGEQPGGPSRIATIRGVGYRLQETPDDIE